MRKPMSEAATTACLAVHDLRKVQHILPSLKTYADNIIAELVAAGHIPFEPGIARIKLPPGAKPLSERTAELEALGWHLVTPEEGAENDAN